MSKSAEEILAMIFAPDKRKVSKAEYQDYLWLHWREKSEFYKREKKQRDGIFADHIRFEYFMTGENDWHPEDITHCVIDRNPNITTLTVHDSAMLIRPDLPLESAEEYLQEPHCATYSLRTIVNGRIIWENTCLNTLLAMYENDGEYKPFGCGCGYSECAGIAYDYNIKTVHTDDHVILYMKNFSQNDRCGTLCNKFNDCRKRNGKCSALKAQNGIREFKFDKYAFKQQIFAVISSRIAIENIHKVWETPEDTQQTCSEADRFCTGGFAGARLTRLFCTDGSRGELEVETSKAIRQLRQEMIMEAIQYHKEHYHPEEQEQEPKQ